MDSKRKNFDAKSGVESGVVVCDDHRRGAWMTGGHPFLWSVGDGDADRDRDDDFHCHPHVFLMNGGVAFFSCRLGSLISLVSSPLPQATVCGWDAGCVCRCLCAVLCLVFYGVVS